METINQNFPSCYSRHSQVGNLLLSERDGNMFHTIPSIEFRINSRKPTTLWKRWKPLFLCFLNNSHHLIHVGNLLLSERDGNSYNFLCTRILLLFRRKPTTLWKRWKQCSLLMNTSYLLSTSETYYSLKEMETQPYLFRHTTHPFLSETYYSLKEMETQLEEKRWELVLLLVGNLLLSERDGNSYIFANHSAVSITRRKPTTLWKRWKRVYPDRPNLLDKV